MTKKLTPMQAIKIYCKNSCCSKDIESWQECNIIKCPLFIFRLGKKIKEVKKQIKKKRFIVFCKKCGKKYNRKLRTTNLCDKCWENAFKSIRINRIAKLNEIKQSKRFL